MAEPHITDEQIRAFVRSGLDVELSLRLGWVTGIAAKLGYEYIVPVSALAARISNESMREAHRLIMDICLAAGVDPSSLEPEPERIAHIKERMARVGEVQ